jgi:carbon-monoxide dehydrogenase small subunit
MKTLINIHVNGIEFSLSVDPFITVADLLREILLLSGTRLGCEYGSCGSCTVLINKISVRSCLELAIRLDGSSVITVEGLNENHLELNELQEEFSKHHALQCGYCTSGMLITCTEYLEQGGTNDEESIRDALSGNLCRCTGYQGAVDAVQAVIRNRIQT